ncbi:helix-hairpin-helix domain-containing protein [Lentibacillus sp. CBA3610]|uniref:helix-hairpin-helix domain-containing protein n=1 Tax=Lentibacillus sp. CBA3610 TaxID=2518176 RepID=UPI001595D09B|nr:helix-hairpin-helix domain-containing protein [Lentibacillus sp. CBA3610]QKY69513.1 ComEA family DNA-binding protein [Lentibacillus sp. CBA3610]
MFEPFKKYLFPIVIAIVIAAFLFLNHDDADENVSQINQNQEEQPDSLNEKEQAPAIVMVDVKGEVATPGVYEIESESRVNDVIQMAGGFTEDADQSMVNLAQKVQDEMIIMIPKMGEQVSGSSPGGNGDDKVRINYATQEEIEQLNGIGPSKAAAIIQYRDENGIFETEEDLLDVSGIGEKTLDSLKEDIQVP